LVIIRLKYFSFINIYERVKVLLNASSNIASTISAVHGNGVLNNQIFSICGV